MTSTSTTLEVTPDVGVSLGWQDIQYKHIIARLSGVARPGELVAIMGPSGAGKSTLLNVLSGLEKPDGGKILDDSTRAFKDIAAYVRQEDILYQALTVRENLYYSAKLLGAEEGAIEEALNDFGLKRVENNKVDFKVPFIGSKISGGEKRRLSLAIEMLNPHKKIFFLDEPTSGLDAVAAKKIVQLLKHKAKKDQLTILATIHQPSTDVFELFDRVCFLARGKVMFFGPRDDIPEYCNSIGYPVPQYMNIAEHFISIINLDFEGDVENPRNEDSLQKINETYSQSQLKTNLDEELKGLNQAEIEKEGEPPSARIWWITKTMILIQRGVMNSLTNPLLYYPRIAMYLAMAILMGTVWLKLGDHQDRVQDRMSVFFFSVAFLCFMAVAGIPAFYEDYFVGNRERANGWYGSSNYVVASTISCIPGVGVIAIVFTSVAYFLIGLHDGATQFFLFFTYLFLALLVAEALVAFIGTLISNPVFSLAFVAFANGFFMVVQGYFVSFKTLPAWIKWAHWIDYQGYSFEGMVVNDMQGLVFQCDAISDGICHCIIPPSIPNSCNFTGEDLIEYYDYGHVRLGRWAGLLIAIMVVFRVLMYIVMIVRGKFRI